MQTLTFTQKLLRQRRFLSSLIPLLALFLGLGASRTAMAQAKFYDNAVTFSRKPTGNAVATTNGYYGIFTAGDNPYDTYDALGTASTTPATVTPSLGIYNIDAGGTSQLVFTGGSIVVDPPSSTRNNVITITGTLQGGRLKYRSYLKTANPVPDYSEVTFGPGIAYATGGTQYSTNNTNIDLTAGLLSGGEYVFEARFEVDARSNSTGIVTTTVDPSSSYTAKFTVTSPLVTPGGGTTTWISQISTDWLEPTNWSNGVPNSGSDAFIPGKSPNSAINTSSPVLSSQDSTVYNVRSLTLDGSTNSGRALLRIGSGAGATLNVYGDLSVISSGILASSVGAPGASRKDRNSTIVLRGGNQKIKGTISIPDLVVSGTGTKAIINVINVNNTVVFDPSTVAGVLMETVTEESDGSVTLNTSGTPQLKLNGSIVSLLSPLSSETNKSFARGVTVAQRTLFRSLTINNNPVSQIGVMNTFGNIGLDITPRTLDSDPLVTITRTVSDPLFSPASPSTAKPIKRQYGVTGDINNSPNVSDIVFHYLDSEDELNGNNDENQLIIFRATNNGPPYAPVGGTVNTVANTVTRNTITAINTITLGSKNNPLPVTVSSFGAKRVGNDALVSWTTAQEIGNKGFNVQVSTDGKEFRTLGFIASASPNSVRATSYSYTDTEKNKSGLRYYRLTQIDTDGKTTSFVPRAVFFDGKVSSEGTTAFAYPNPFTNDITLSLSSKMEGQGQVIITDMTGRTVSKRPITVGTGSNDVPLTSLNDLKSGIYVMYITLPSGETKNLKVVKQ